ncbi:hypothetical protein APR50_10420 [Variovorax paradoxus]|uniref:hypothetical protein n=1 Tax=Variovorax paradoxus TaxID=34073 RepID=UPI0006E6F1FD|nr:hypothetical protein APR52_20670 [Variovorax paradoxus]KPV08877.1 hypothetical protein APR50_10420 [Variovorax paradoxus]KPV11374.1 hypothetical protein APR49_09295 [Variovorax paradoxus]KPV23266.1 hypothetical protein APR51_07870 [Variovorax paradoxus]KPV31168.1 hypothetical protein APR48_17735 [Variovorax paradoxus]
MTRKTFWRIARDVLIVYWALVLIAYFSADEPHSTGAGVAWRLLITSAIWLAFCKFVMWPTLSYLEKQRADSPPEN